MPVDRDLWEKELGRLALRAVEDLQGGASLGMLVRSDAVKLLQEVQDILDNEGLNDIECLEEIISAFGRAGIYVSRHRPR